MQRADRADDRLTWKGRTIMTSQTVTSVIPREQSSIQAMRVPKSLLGQDVVAGALFETAVRWRRFAAASLRHRDGPVDGRAERRGRARYRE
jgi:hypothetical protein